MELGRKPRGRTLRAQTQSRMPGLPGRKLGRSSRWAVPAVAVLAVGGVIAGTTVAGAQTAPPLPVRSPAALLAEVQQATGPGPMTATIQEIASLGLPDLPGADGAWSPVSLLSGSHTFTMWYADPAHVRLAESAQLGETDLRINGNQLWLWDSKAQTATHILLRSPTPPAGWSGQPPSAAPARTHLGGTVSVHAGKGMLSARMTRARMDKLRALGARGGRADTFGHHMLWARVGKARAGEVLRAGAPAGPPVAEPTPLQVARQVLAAIGPTTNVSVQRNVMVAGQAAYQLAIAPKDSRSLVGRILIAVDAARHFPLRVQVFARGASSPAFQIGFTGMSFGRPAASNFTFTPPPGAKVKSISTPAGLGVPGLRPSPMFGKPGPHGSLFAKQTPSWSASGSSSSGWSASGSKSSGSISSASAQPTVMGKGWLSVLVVPAGATLGGPTTIDTYGSHPAGYSKSVTMTVSPSGGPAGIGGSGSAMLGAALRSATPVSGKWGSGHLLRTSLVSVLITSKGTVLAGAVRPSVLYADAARIK